MLRMATLASGSSGNCAVVSDGRVHILIDAGISTRRISQGLKALGVELRHISGVLITHEHTDHVAALPVLCKQTGAPLFTTEGTASELCGRWSGLVERPCGFSVTDGTRKLVLCTDTGVITPEAREEAKGAHTLVGEFNYDPEMLRTGPYPVYLKERIRGDRGHLSNEMGGQLAAWAGAQGARRVILAHLSQENNLPRLALEAARKALAELGLKEGSDVELVAAPRGEATDWFEV